LPFPERKDVVAKNNWTSPEKIVTLGPYRLKSMQPHRIELVRNPRYWGKAPQVERIEMYIVSEDADARKLFEDGKLDYLQNVSAEDIQRFGNKGRYINLPYLKADYIGFFKKEGIFFIF